MCLKKEYEAGDPVEAIRKIMDEDGLNQKQLAERMGLTRQNVSQVLNRGRKTPRFDSIRKMVDALGCEIIIRRKE